MKLHRLPALLPLLASSLSAGSLLWAASAQAATEPADDAADAQSRCSDLKEVELPDVVIQRVKWVQRGGLAQDPNSAFTGASGQTLQAEEHCVVRGEIEPRTGADGRHYGTQFELRLACPLEPQVPVPGRWRHQWLRGRCPGPHPHPRQLGPAGAAARLCRGQHGRGHQGP